MNLWHNLCMDMTVTVGDLGTLLKLWRTVADLSHERAAAGESNLLPGSRSISSETVRRYENNQFGKQGPDPVTLAALTKALGHEIEDLPPEARDDVEALQRFFVRGPSSPLKRRAKAGVQSSWIAPSPLRAA